MLTRSKIRKAGAILTAVLSSGVLSCGSESDDDLIIEGVNMTALFAPPAFQESGAVLDDWSAREPEVSRVLLPVLIDTITIGGSAYTVGLLHYTVEDVSMWGAILAPLHGTSGSTPVLVYAHGGDDGVRIEEVLSLLPFALGDMQDDFVYVIPAYRSEPLGYAGMLRVTLAEPSPWNRDVDDALALLDYTLRYVDAADSTRIGVVGISRGPTVGMLMGIRDERIDLVVEYFGPTDFFGEFAQEVFKDALLDSLHDLPGLSDLNEQIIQPLKNGTISIPEARLEILRRSPAYFVDALPPTEGHHGTADAVVPVSEAERLADVFASHDLSGTDYHVYIYPGGQHNPLTLSGSLPRLQTFLRRLTDPVL